MEKCERVLPVHRLIRKTCRFVCTILIQPTRTHTHVVGYRCAVVHTQICSFVCCKIYLLTRWSLWIYMRKAFVRTTIHTKFDVYPFTFSFPFTVRFSTYIQMFGAGAFFPFASDGIRCTIIIIVLSFIPTYKGAHRMPICDVRKKRRRKTRSANKKMVQTQRECSDCSDCSKCLNAWTINTFWMGSDVTDLIVTSTINMLDKCMTVGMGWFMNATFSSKSIDAIQFINLDWTQSMFVPVNTNGGVKPNDEGENTLLY